MTIETLERPAVVEAAAATIAVVVTQDDIDRGKQKSVWDCAIARAFERMGVFAVVAPGTARVNGRRYDCSASRQWVRDFDRDKARVHPERFVWHRVDRRTTDEREFVPS